MTLLTAALLLGGHPEIAAAGCGLAGLVALTLWSPRIGWRRAGAVGGGDGVGALVGAGTSTC